MSVSQFQKVILAWYKKNRRDLPWRRTKDPYKILVSEIMLQQTQISRVLPKYEEFLKAFPTLEALEKAPDKKLLKLWAGLGYWRRAKYLKEAAKTILGEVRETNFENRGVLARQSQVPYVTRQKGETIFKISFSEPRKLEDLPGIGHYTARALACFTFNHKEAFLDTNIRRIYLHFFFDGKENVSDKEILKVAQKAIDKLPNSVSPREWHYALFDYGAIELKDKTINKRSRHYHKQSTFKGSFRSFRAKAVRFLLQQAKNRATHRQLASFLRKELDELNLQRVYAPKQIIDALLKDKLIKKSKHDYFL